MFLGEIIKEYRGRNDMSMEDFAAKAGLSKGYISMLEKNKHPQNERNIIPSLLTFQKVANAINVKLDDLIRMVDSNQKISLTSEDGIEGSQVPNLFVSEPTHESATVIMRPETPIAPHEVQKFVGDSGYFALEIDGNSMEPKYNHGDIIICKSQSSFESGQDCVLWIKENGKTIPKFRRVIKDGDNLILQTINPDYPPRTYREDQIEIVGIGVEVRRKI